MPIDYGVAGSAPAGVAEGWTPWARDMVPSATHYVGNPWFDPSEPYIYSQDAGWHWNPGVSGGMNWLQPDYVPGEVPGPDYMPWGEGQVATGGQTFGTSEFDETQAYYYSGDPSLGGREGWVWNPYQDLFTQPYSREQYESFLENPENMPVGGSPFTPIPPQQAPVPDPPSWYEPPQYDPPQYDPPQPDSTQPAPSAPTQSTFPGYQPTQAGQFTPVQPTLGIDPTQWFNVRPARDGEGPPPSSVTQNDTYQVYQWIDMNGQHRWAAWTADTQKDPNKVQQAAISNQMMMQAMAQQQNALRYNEMLSYHQQRLQTMPDEWIAGQQGAFDYATQGYQSLLGNLASQQGTLGQAWDDRSAQLASEWLQRKQDVMSGYQGLEAQLSGEYEDLYGKTEGEYAGYGKELGEDYQRYIAALDQRYAGREREALGLLAGQGDAARRRLEQSRQEQMAGVQQEMVSKGLGASTVTTGMQEGVGRDYQELMADLEERQSAQKFDAYTGLRGSQLDAWRQATEQQLGAQAALAGEGRQALRGLDLQRLAAQTNLGLQTQSAAAQAYQDYIQGLGIAGGEALTAQERMGQYGATQQASALQNLINMQQGMTSGLYDMRYQLSQDLLGLVEGREDLYPDISQFYRDLLPEVE